MLLYLNNLETIYIHGWPGEDEATIATSLAVWFKLRQLKDPLAPIPEILTGIGKYKRSGQK